GAGRGERSSSADLGRGGSVSGAKHVHARVSAEGRTRVLLISSHKDIRRTISTFGAKEASLVRQEWQGRLVLDKYLRYLTAFVSQLDAIERSRRTHFRALAALEGRSSQLSPEAVSLTWTGPSAVRRDFTPAAAVSVWSNSASPVATPNNNTTTENGRPASLSSKADTPRAGSRSLPSRRRQGGDPLAPFPVDPGVVTPADVVAVDETGPMSMKHLRELERSLGMDEPKVLEVLDAERVLANEMRVGISETHQVFVEVLAATSLRPTGLQGYSDPYCVCYLKIPDSTGGSKSADDRFRGQRGETYFCEKTLNPKWSGQRFIFKVPPAAVQRKRGHGVRVLVLSRNLVRPNDFLGQADVPLSLLQDEREHVGWFPLNRRSSRLMHLAAGDKIAGSVKLRVQWVFSLDALLHTQIRGLELFLGTVEARLQRIRLLIERLKKEEAKDRKTQLGMTVRGRKENSKIARLKRHLEKMGFKGIGSDSKDGAGSAHGDHRKTPPFKSPLRGGGATITTPGGQLVRANSPTLASPSAHGYGSRFVARLSSPSSGGGGPGFSINAEG
ncbi:unnamed protein product, partial [Ectocarpus sp. 8 AP-2014]